MSAIRPMFPEFQPPVGPAANAQAAQAAFFRAALGQTPAARPAGMATQLAVQAAVAPPQITTPEPRTADRSGRPGALLDIRV